MSVVDKKLMFINSYERNQGKISDFKISIPSHLLTCQQNQRMRVVLNDLVLPYTWYNVQEINRSFQVTENGVERTVSLDVGSYHALQLRDQVQAKLTAGGVYTYTITFNEVDSKFAFVIDNPQGVNSFTFDSGAASAAKLLGFSVGTHAFTGSTLLSTNAISTIFTDALLLHSDLPNTNVDRGAGAKETYHLSSVFAKVAINTSPFNNIIFENRNDDYLVNVSERQVTELRMWFTTAEHEYITLNDDYSFTLKIEVLEDDDKTLIQQNSGLAELLRMMVMQMHMLLEALTPRSKN
jgi:hypothetical protein